MPLILVRRRYGTPKAVALAEGWMAAIKKAAYLASAELAREKGPFPLYDARALAGGA
jgi:ribonucleoside-diphosphate reductase alpha chain